MHTAAEYLEKTESATRKLFDAIEMYLETLRAGIGPTFITSKLYGPEQDLEFQAWRTLNTDALTKAKIARTEFIAESFALNTICGAILQIAEKGLEIYSNNAEIPDYWKTIIKRNQAKFCVGRTIRNTPLGLIVYAARNQHTHFNDNQLREPSSSVFKNLSESHGYKSTAADPAFDLQNPSNLSYASNVTSLIDWRSFEQYENDMRNMLNI
ncbi:hypothetical protein [Pseudomonas leptonychotis]|uniref:hypothetical protein n=1 Tax=Pseudomonas leptonychotis TaxID=2448482 RepID=UPI0038644012